MHAGFGKGHGLGIALHQLGKLAGELTQPTVGLAQVGGGEIQSHEVTLGQGPPDLAEGPSGASGDVEHPQRTCWPRCKGRQSFD